MLTGEKEIMNKRKETPWWLLLDWSEMQLTFNMLPEEYKKEVLEKAYWGKGKGIFNSQQEIKK